MFAPAFGWPYSKKPMWHRVRRIRGVAMGSCHIRCVVDESKESEMVPSGEKYCSNCAAMDASASPNAETVAALKEADAGGGEIFTGSTEEAVEKNLAEDEPGGVGQTPRS